MEIEIKKISRMKILRKDSLLFGIAVAIVLPLIIAVVLFVVYVFFAPAEKGMLIKLPTLILIAVFSNLIPMRYYLLKLKFDRTGRGILLVTFVFALAYFAAYSWFFE
jgi:hypothetical protein